MTKFVLEGGRPASPEIDRSAFIEEIVRGFNQPVRLLDCFFARPIERWQESFAKNKELFKKCLPTKQIQFELADGKNFIEQVVQSDAIYLHGGTTKELLNALIRQTGWQEKLEGKTLVGSSAGANVMGRYYFGLHSFKIEEGLNLLPIKVVSHFRSDFNAPNIDWEVAYAELKAHKEDLPIVALREGQFEIRSDSINRKVLYN